MSNSPQQAAALTVEQALQQAIACHKAGRLEDAERLYRAILSAQPNHPDANHNLGVLAVQVNQLAAALPHFKAALEAYPVQWQYLSSYADALLASGQAREALNIVDNAMRRGLNTPEAHALRRRTEDALLNDGANGNAPTPADINQLVALFNAGRHPELESRARELVDERPQSGLAWKALGIALKAQGKDALSALQNAANLLPEDAEAQLNLGTALTDLGRLDEAAASYRRALEINPDYAEAHRNLGSVLQYQGRIAEAEASWRRALEIRPEFAEAMVCMAELLIGKGKFPEAEALHRRVIAVEPENPEAWAGIARCRKMSNDDGAWLGAAQKLAEKSLPPQKESILRFAIGKYYDDIKEFDQAFINYRRGNELTKRFATRYNRQQATQTVDLLIRTFDREWISRPRINANQSARPVFIVGMPRSGTSLAEQILASHPSVFGAGELIFWQTLLGAENLAALTGAASDQALRKAADDYLGLLAGYSPDALRVVDKMPANFMALGLIRAAFPNASFIHMRRNPLDTCLSVYFQNFQSTYSYANDLEDLAHYYVEYCRIMEHWQATFAQDAILDVAYEDLIDDQERWSRKMIEYIGLPWDERCIDFHLTDRTVQTASRWQVRQKISRTSVERWRNYEKFLGPLMGLTR